MEALPGPLFTVGLSMGGATALSLAATHSDKVSKTAVFAPLLKVSRASSEPPIGILEACDLHLQQSDVTTSTSTQMLEHKSRTVGGVTVVRSQI